MGASGALCESWSNTYYLWESNTVTPVLLGHCAVWIVLWHTTLHKINAFRDVLGLNRYAVRLSSH